MPEFEVEREPRPRPSIEWEPESLIAALVNAAKFGDWKAVDRIASQFAGHDGDEMVIALDGFTTETDENIRDGVMTAWSFLNPIQTKRKAGHFGTAAWVMMNDPHECSAVWGAVTVARYLTEPSFEKDAVKALSQFRERIKRMDAQEKGLDWARTAREVRTKCRGRVSLPYLDM